MQIRERLMAYGPNSFVASRRILSSTETQHGVSLQPLVSLLNRMLKGLHGGRCATVDMDNVRDHIMAAEMPRDVQENALHHLRNAVRYISKGETGAARWELSTVRQSLLQHRSGHVRLETRVLRG